MKPIREINFTIPIEPKSVQHGARTNFRSRRFYNDKEKTAYISRIIEESTHHKPDKPNNGPVSVAMRFYLPRPEWVKAEPMIELPAWAIGGGHPDDDNLYKGTKDALTKAGFWINDSQIIESRLRCFWASSLLFPRIEVDLIYFECPEGNTPPAAIPKQPKPCRKKRK